MLVKCAKHKHVDRCAKRKNNDHLKYFHAKDISRERERDRDRQTDRGRTSDVYNQNLGYLKIIDIRLDYTELWRRRLYV